MTLNCKRLPYIPKHEIVMRSNRNFSEFKRGLELKELATDSQIKKLKTEARASNSFQFKGNKLQFEFNSSLLDSINNTTVRI